MELLSTLPAPSATANGEEHADWLELTALGSPRHVGSAEELISALRACGATDALVDDVIGDDDADLDAATDRGSERTQVLAESALAFADERSRSVLRDLRYPFAIQGRSVLARHGAARSLYTYLLLLSHYGAAAGPVDEDGAELFEGIAAVAARNYLGGDATRAVAYRFGSPRRDAPSSFIDALDDMCAKMDEGGGANRSRPRIIHQMDAKLDLAAWIPMPDNRYGKVVGFGQCATGKDWVSKANELQASSWCHKWLLEQPPVIPFRMFFIPHRVSNNDWTDRAHDAGVIFDRCRLTAYAASLPQALRRRVWRWNAHVIRERLGI